MLDESRRGPLRRLLNDLGYIYGARIDGDNAALRFGDIEDIIYRCAMRSALEAIMRKKRLSGPGRSPAIPPANNSE